MKSYDYDAVVYDGSEYCVECLPEGVKVHDEDVSPIFADAEMDRPAICDNCGTEHTYMNITSDRNDPASDEPEPLAETLDKAFHEADNANVNPAGSLHDILTALDTRYGERTLIHAIAAYWRRSPEILVNRLREAGMEVT